MACCDAYAPLPVFGVHAVLMLSTCWNDSRHWMRPARTCPRTHIHASTHSAQMPETANDPEREGPKWRKRVLIPARVTASLRHRSASTPGCRPHGRTLMHLSVVRCMQNGNVVAALGTPPDNHLFELKCRVTGGQPDCAIPDNPRKKWGGAYSCSKVRGISKRESVLEGKCARALSCERVCAELVCGSVDARMCMHAHVWHAYTHV